MRHTMRIVLTGVLATGALATGGIAMAAAPSNPEPEDVMVVVEQAGPASPRPIQDLAPEDCPGERASDGGTTGAVGRL